MKRFFLLLFLLTAAIASAQSQKQQITGRVQDADGNPVPFAHVVLHNTDSDSVLAGTTTADDGSFLLPCGEGTFRVEVSSVGFERLVVRCEAGDLGALTLNAKQLNAVSVTASRTTEQVDRYVVLPKPEEVASAGRTLVLLDMLKLPGLRVDVALQQITVDGGMAILQINGKEVPLTRLANLRAEQIKRVEYSNNPGTRYLDRGATGIINLSTATCSAATTKAKASSRWNTLSATVTTTMFPTNWRTDTSTQPAP